MRTYVCVRIPPHRPILANPGRPPAADSTAQIRFCSRHGAIEFHRHSRGDGRAIWRCKRCVGEAVTRRHHRVKAILVAEAGGRCAVCGYDRCTVSLHFHHVDPAMKSFAVNMSNGKSLARYRAEARKCVLVCANCHGEIEAGLTPSPPAGAHYPVRLATLSPRMTENEPERPLELFPAASSAGLARTP